MQYLSTLSHLACLLKVSCPQIMTQPDDNTPDFVSSYLLYLLAASSERASDQFHAHVKSLGLRVTEWRVLACLSDKPSMMITRLADLSLMEQSRMTRVVDQMVARGLVARVEDAKDKRRIPVKLTDEGQHLADRLVKDARDHEAELLSSLADTDAERIKAALQELLKRIPK